MNSRVEAFYAWLARLVLYKREKSMKLLQSLLSISLAGCILLGCSDSGNKKPDKKTKEKGAFEETTDYLTGKTPIEEGRKATARLTRLAIEKAVNSYEVMEGRKPESLQELVDARHLSKKYLKDEWGNDLISEQAGGKFIVRSPGRDRKPGTADDWDEEF